MITSSEMHKIHDDKTETLLDGLELVTYMNLNGAVLSCIIKCLFSPLTFLKGQGSARRWNGRMSGQGRLFYLFDKTAGFHRERETYEPHWSGQTSGINIKYQLKPCLTDSTWSLCGSSGWKPPHHNQIAKSSRLHLVWQFPPAPSSKNVSLKTLS